MYLNTHAGMTADQLKRIFVGFAPPPHGVKSKFGDFHEYDSYAFAGTVIRIVPSVYVVQSCYWKDFAAGGFLVVTRGKDGSFRPLWNIKDVAKQHYPPIRQGAFDPLARTEVSSEETSKSLFDRCTGIRRACQALCTERFGIAPVEIYRETSAGGNSKRMEIAVRGLAETGSREDGRRLLELLNHRSARVRSAAVHGLGVLKVEQIEEKLLERISSDSRSVAREATSVLLLRKSASPMAISAAAKQNSDGQAQLAVLRQMWRAGKWVQLRLYLNLPPPTIGNWLSVFSNGWPFGRASSTVRSFNLPPVNSPNCLF